MYYSRPHYSLRRPKPSKKTRQSDSRSSAWQSQQMIKIDDIITQFWRRPLSWQSLNQLIWLHHELSRLIPSFHRVSLSFSWRFVQLRTIYFPFGQQNDRNNDEFDLLLYRDIYRFLISTPFGALYLPSSLLEINPKILKGNYKRQISRRGPVFSLISGWGSILPPGSVEI